MNQTTLSFLFLTFLGARCVEEAEAAGGPGRSALDFFNVTDAFDITWSHATNSRAALQQALDDDIFFFEADVLMEGQGLANQTTTPIMAHPPQISSDTTLEYFLATTIPAGRGIKLDIKSDDAVRPTLEQLQTYPKPIRQPVWVNADIWVGPGGSTPRNGTYLVAAVNDVFPSCTLSLGWTVSSGNTLEAGYSQQDVQEADDFCGDLKQPVTFPVHAGLVKRSWRHLSWLLNQDPSRYSLTVWTSSLVEWEDEDMVYVRSQTEPSQVYFDLPADRIQNIKRLEAAGSATTLMTSSLPLLVVFAATFVNMLTA